MKTHWISKFALGFLVLALSTPALAAPAAAPAAGLAGLTLAEAPFSLLGGRLTLRLPGAARVEPRGGSIMAASAAVEEETRVVLDVGPARLVLMAFETFGRSEAADFEADVRADLVSLGGGPSTAEPLVLASKLAAIVVTPKDPPDPAKEAWLALAAYVRHTDGTVQYLAFYLNPEAAKDVEGARTLARAALATVAAGTKALPLEAGERSLRGAAGTETLVVDAPAGTITSVNEGPDFAVLYVRPLARLGAPSSGLGIYLGGHPSYQYAQRQNRSMGAWTAAVTKSPAALLGAPAAEWHRWAADGVETAEAIVPYPGQDGWLVHVFCSGPAAADVEALQKVAATLRVKK